MYIPGTLKVSNMTSAVYSRFSGGFSGGSVCTCTAAPHTQLAPLCVRAADSALAPHQQHVVLLRLNAQVVVIAALPQLLHVVPVLNQPLPDGVV